MWRGDIYIYMATYIHTPNLNSINNEVIVPQLTHYFPLPREYHFSITCDTTLSLQLRNCQFILATRVKN